MIQIFTFSTLELRTGAVRDVVGGVALEAVGGARAEAAVSGAALAASLRRVVEGLGTGGHTLAFIQVTLHPKLIYRKKKSKSGCEDSVELSFLSSGKQET